MRAKSAEHPGAGGRAIPPELANIVGLAGALFGVVASGAAIASALPTPASPWLLGASYGAPGAIAFAVYWWNAQRV